MLKTIYAAIAALLVSVGVTEAQHIQPQISLNGTGVVTAQPDTAHVTLSVVSDGLTPAAATQANSKSMKAVCQAIEGLKVDGKDIRTSGFSVTPKYEQKVDRETKIVGYTVTNSLVIVVRDISSLGSILDTAITKGANHVSGIHWDVADKTQLLIDARNAAFKDAYAKAKLYAAAGNFNLGSVLTLQESSSYMGGQEGGAYMRMNGAADRMPVPTNPGEIRIQVQVSVSWNIATAGFPIKGGIKLTDIVPNNLP